jgi:hypothetical protein
MLAPVGCSRLRSPKGDQDYAHRETVFASAFAQPSYGNCVGFDLCAADSPDTVLRERRVVVVDPSTGRAIPQRHPPAIHITISVDLQAVVDLTSDENCDALGIDANDLVAEWRAFPAASKTPPTHLIGEAARTAGIEALIVPSARVAGTKNIAIIIDRLRTGSHFEIYRPEGFPDGTATRLDGDYKQLPID